MRWDEGVGENLWKNPYEFFREPGKRFHPPPAFPLSPPVTLYR
jgi:hypothetical protein